MEKQQLRASTEADIKNHVAELRKELFLLRMKRSTGQLKTTHEFKEIKRNIARALTIQTELALGSASKEGVN